MTRVDTELDELWTQFHGVVNMTSEQLRDWLASTPDVMAPQGAREEPESDLPSLGWEVVKVLGKRRGDVTEEDRRLMTTVLDIVRDRLASPPPDGAANDEWRRELMCLGHDPLRAG